MKYICLFSDLIAQHIEVSGGKGANLAKMYRAEFPVPNGFIISEKTYRCCVESLRDVLVEKVQGFNLEKPEELKKQAEELQSIFHEMHFPQQVVDEVEEVLKNWQGASHFSVRSSSTMEDLASAAFAGQHDSFLNCSKQQVLGKIKACFASLWNDRAILYREQNNFKHLEASMAVVVQEMIPCEVAGVMFSVNPVTGNFDECMVNANYGLGESVVSGAGDVDHVILNKQSGEIIEKNVATHREVVRCNDSGVSAQAQNDDSDKLSISDVFLQQLLEVTKKIELFYRFPQDIEWGIYNDKLYILQSRPITKFPERWTRDESAERYPYVMTPLSWDFVEDGFHESLNYSLSLIGLPCCSGKWFSIFDNYIYGNQNIVKLYLEVTGFKASSFDEIRTLVPMFRENFRWVQSLPNEWMQGLDKYLLCLGGLLQEDISEYSIDESWEYLTRVRNLGNDYFKPNIAISLTQGSLYRFFYQMLVICYKDPHVAQKMLLVLTSAVQTKTKQVNHELHRLAKELQAQPELQQLISEKGSRWVIEEGKIQNFTSFYKKFMTLIATHGHREFDIDPYHATYEDAPWTVLDTIVLNTHSEIKEDYYQDRKQKIQALEAEKKLLNDIPQDLHFFAMEVLRLVRSYTELDDFEHYQTTRLTLAMRKGLKSLGKHLQHKGLVADPADIYFARATELEAAIVADDENTYKNLASLIANNKKEYLANQQRTPQWNLHEEAQEQVASDVLRGIPGSPGTVEGQVFLLQSTDDFARFPKGAILVARTTNPAWTPIFYSASAVITESGGPLSHGAVTAREMQIPAVMAVKNVLHVLENGQKVKVDGASGTVFLNVE